ncbi:integral membrane protein [Fusarium sporotrichioides]|uniref:Integral membrane protein n=1 Tax=Fusarium sporotrichioides TaxID=5514 RepID=A0A395RS09_FUSSP|nr:integral membrane protein [Fusarium sporotrichioides]
MYVADTFVPDECYALVIVGFLFTCLATIFVVLRLVTRVCFVRNVGVDDGLIILANLGTLGFLIAVMQQVRFGLGLPPSPKLLSPFIQATVASVISYTICHLAIKLSIAFQCLRIFITPKARCLYIGLIVYFAVYGMLCLMLTVFTCYPVAKYWDDSISGRCLDNRALRYAFAGINIVNDTTLLVAPMPFLRNLQIARRIKVVLMGVFAAGAVSVSISHRPAKGVDIAIWSGLECNIAIMCACAPSLKPLFTRTFPNFLASLQSSKAHFSGNPHSPGSLHIYDNSPKSQPLTHGTDLGITVQQSFEMRTTTAASDDTSEKNLVTVNTAQYHTKRVSHGALG